MSAAFTVHIVAIPAFADSKDTFQLGFLDSIKDPASSRSRAPASKPKARGQHAETAKISAASQRGLGPVWMWLPPPPDRLAPAVIASR
ncbi:MAG: hypothetical protein O3B21_00280 [Proteobacteria bacterium]|nr:hypothetical protein [Pseudomonadota bacterium]MDA1355823.1 hypothetical protein [Pseudomonadota bacterium]